MKTIDIIIKKDGKVEIDVKGCSDASCLKMTKKIETALGGNIEERKAKNALVDSKIREIEKIKIAG